MKNKVIVQTLRQKELHLVLHLKLGMMQTVSNKELRLRLATMQTLRKIAASRATSKASYDANPERKRAASRAASKASYGKNPKVKIASSQAYYADNKESMCAKRRGRYALAEPKPDVKDMYLKEIQANLLANSESRVQLMKAFKKQHETLVKRTHRVVGKTVRRIKPCKCARSRLGLCSRLLASIQSLQIRGSEDFVEGCHTAATERYHYDSAYQLVKKPHAIPIREVHSSSDRLCIAYQEATCNTH